MGRIIKNEELLELTKNFPSLHVKVKKLKGEDISTDELKQKLPFTASPSLNMLSPSFSIKDDKLCVFYTTINNLRIEKEGKLVSSPCSITLRTMGDIDLFCHTRETDELYSTWKNCELKSKYTLKNGMWKINDSKLLLSENNTKTIKEDIVISHILFNGKKLTQEDIIQQPCISLTQWEKTQQNVKKVVSHVSNNMLSYNDTSTTINVSADLEYIYVKKDEHGNIRETSSTTLNNVDVTKECVILLDNPLFQCKPPFIITQPQHVGADEKICTIFINYEGVKTNIVIKQEKGIEYQYNNVLEFANKEHVLTLMLNSSQETNTDVHINAIKEQKLENVVINQILNNNLILINNNDWIDTLFGEDNVLHLHMNANLGNLQRQGNIIISDGENNITLRIVQPFRKVKNALYSLQIDGGGQFTEETIASAHIAIKAYKTVQFDNGHEEMQECFDKLNIKYEWVGDKENIDGGVIRQVDFNGKYEIKPTIKDLTQPCELKGYVWIDETNKYEFNITYVPNKREEYKSIEINIIIRTNNTNDVWANHSGELVIYDNEVSNKYILQPLWVNGQMKEDNVLSITKELAIGKEYNFIVQGIYVNTQDEPLFLQETYLIEEDDKAIDLILVIG